MNLHKNVKTIRLFLAKLFIAFKIVYSCCFSLGGNLDFPEFLQKSFYNINNILKTGFDNGSVDDDVLVSPLFPRTQNFLPSSGHEPSGFSL